MDKQETHKTVSGEFGRRSAGIPKNFSGEELQRRRERIMAINEAKAVRKVQMAVGVAKPRVTVAAGVLMRPK